jgi:hypothetical protein
MGIMIMNELIAALVSVALSMGQLPPPKYEPVVKAASYEEIIEKACGSQEVCKDIHVYTDPLDGIIYVDKGIDYTFTLAKAELFYEVARHVLSSHDIYSYNNSCERNIEIEKALIRMRFDYIKTEVDSGRYKGYGVPQLQDLPTHIFYCTKEEDRLPEVKI